MALQRIDTLYSALALNGNVIPTFTTANTFIGNTSNRVGNVFATAFNANSTSTFANIIPNANVTANIGSSTAWFNTFFGVSTQARYADLAENYRSDANYAAGTVLEFGGSEEVTLAEDGTRAVAGVVSTHPAYLMNGGLVGENIVSLALVGRVPCKVRGKIKKGDMLVSGGNGYARPDNSPQLGAVIGKALEDFDGVDGIIEVVVGRV
ncbi:hypothetical protein UFOVP257_13 [uncultured Caudovirales phage]|uniref:Uncharacterized protein n=1 Tax=uncultured Caudovirales phage TaxID=2100421 RepID=A0A6J5LM99_9CAUD|nr:hypothetical protein UFOVP257_13 [uncultured Caudovirales phage]